MTRPSWLRRVVRNRHRHAIEQASRRWRGGRRDESARTRRKILISTQADTHVLCLEDLPAAATAPEKPPPPLANLCQAAVAREITDDNAFDMLVWADDRQLADLRTECLKHVQRRWNSNLRHWWQASPGVIPGLEAAMAAPSLKSDVERALRGI